MRIKVESQDGSDSRTPVGIRSCRDSDQGSELHPGPAGGILKKMSTVIEIQEAIEKLAPKDQDALTVWLQSRPEPILSAQEEAALLAALDQAAADLDAGHGVPTQTVREQVAKWASK